MNTQTKIRARRSGEQTRVAVLVGHPMGWVEPDGGGAGRHIDRMAFEVNGVLAAEVYMGAGSPANPLASIHLTGTKAGDSLTVRWTDTQGLSGQAETTLP